MSLGHARWLACVVCACAVLACGDDDGNGSAPTGDGGGGNDADGGPGDRDGGGGGNSGSGGGSGGGGDVDSGVDAGPDGAILPPDFLDGDVYYDAQEEDAGPPPEEWTCPDALWNDGICDCGCSATDYDCNQVTNCITPGCAEVTCGACFTADGSWKACAP